MIRRAELNPTLLKPVPADVSRLNVLSTSLWKRVLPFHPERPDSRQSGVRVEDKILQHPGIFKFEFVSIPTLAIHWTNKGRRHQIVKADQLFASPFSIAPIFRSRHHDSISMGSNSGPGCGLSPECKYEENVVG